MINFDVTKTELSRLWSFRLLWRCDTDFFHMLAPQWCVMKRLLETWQQSAPPRWLELLLIIRKTRKILCQWEEPRFQLQPYCCFCCRRLWYLTLVSCCVAWAIKAKQSLAIPGDQQQLMPNNDYETENEALRQRLSNLTAKVDQLETRFLEEQKSTKWKKRY